MFPCYVFELKQTVNNWLAGSTLKKALTLAVEVLHLWDAPNTPVFRVSLLQTVLPLLSIWGFFFLSLDNTAAGAHKLLCWTFEMMSPEVIWAFDLNASGMPPIGNVSKGKGPTAIRPGVAAWFPCRNSSGGTQESDGGIGKSYRWVAKQALQVFKGLQCQPWIRGREYGWLASPYNPLSKFYRMFPG